MNKKILLFANSDSNYVHFRLNLIKKLLKRNYKVYLIVSKDSKFADIINNNLILIKLNLSRHSINFFSEIKLFIQIFFIYKKIRPIYALHFTIKPNIYGSIISRLFHIKSINNITGLGNIFLSKSHFRFLYITLYKLSIKKSYHTFFQNKSDLRYFRYKKIIDSKKNNFSIIPGSGIDLNKFQFEKYTDMPNLKFLFIGRLIKQKGIIEFIEAAKYITSKFNNTKFVIAGDFDKDNNSSIDLDYFKNAIKKNYIEYLGYINPIDKIIKSSHVVILPSYREGLSHSLLISAALGRPLIASNTPGCKELIIEGFNGYLVKPRNYSSLIDKILEFIDQTQEKKITMGKNSRMLIEEKFSEIIVIDQYLNYINKR